MNTNRGNDNRNRGIAQFVVLNFRKTKKLSEVRDLQRTLVQEKQTEAKS